MTRWWTYQKERFPLAQHGPLIFAFSFSGLCFSSLLRGEMAWPEPQQLATAFITALLFFLQLRIADEFKDFEEDARYRPYRPVPRGLVSLRELGWVFAAAGALQLALALALFPPLFWILLAAWIYLAAMSKEFFAREWLKRRPIAYLVSHMAIMPLVDLYVTSCDWRVAGLPWPRAGIYWFLAVSFFNGVMIEFGRKIRTPADEEVGVETYTKLWGVRRAPLAWLAAVACNAVAACFAARSIGFAIPAIAILGALLAAAAAIAFAFRRDPSAASAKRIPIFSALWTLLMYLTLGPISLALSQWL